MSPSIALQLYSIRDQLAADFPGTMHRVAGMGYNAVETAGFPAEYPPAKAARLFRDLGLAVCSVHAPLPFGDKQREAFDLLAAFNCTRAVCAWQPPEQFRSVESIKRTCDQLNQAAEVYRRHGVAFHYHNHWFELYQVEGRTGLAHMLDHLSPDVLLEIDAYWAQTGGADPASLLRELGTRVPLLHLKDGPCLLDEPMTALGAGQVDIPGVLAAASAEWVIVELDRCATDMLAALEQSLRYLQSLHA